MPKIYLGFAHAGSWGLEAVVSYALAEDGVGLGAHLSSTEEWAKHDIGLTSDWHHDAFKEHYPEGYELEWVGCVEDSTHEGWLAALKLNHEAHPEGAHDA